MTFRHVALVSGVTAMAIFGLTQRAGSPAGPWKFGPAQAREPERVRIEQEIVRIPVTTPPPARRVSVSAPAFRTPAARRASVLQDSRPAVRWAARDESQNTGLLSRTVKKIVGDGRYTPQPFPTVKDKR
jgi:hypothetical protein